MTVKIRLFKKGKIQKQLQGSLQLFCAEDFGKEVMWKGIDYSIMLFERGIVERVTSNEHLSSMFKQHYSHYR